MANQPESHQQGRVSLQRDTHADTTVRSLLERAAFVAPTPGRVDRVVDLFTALRSVHLAV